MVGNIDQSGLDDFLRSFNVELGEGVVIDPEMNYRGSLQVVFCFLKAGMNHPVVESLGKDRAVLVANGAPIDILGVKPRPDGEAESVDRRFAPEAILKSGPRSWAETDLKNARPRFDQGADRAGPIVVGAAVVERGAGAAASAATGKPRLVLFSSPSMVENLVQAIEPANLDLAMNAVSWLRERSNAVGIAPKTHVALTLAADPVLRWRLVVVPTVVAVLFIIGAGAVVYVARRE
jgi:hypothetical protein